MSDAPISDAFEKQVERIAAENKAKQGGNPDRDDATFIAALAGLPELEYQLQRCGAAKAIGIPVSSLDKLVRGSRAKTKENESALPHWKVEPWSAPVDAAALLDGIKQIFHRYIVLPAGAEDALALWVLHAWTIDASDVSPFLVLVSPTKRCGKTNTLIILYYLTPRSELASNISASALFRYVEDVRPTLLIDEADSFVKDNEEMRGILNSGHTKTAAHVIRNIEVNGEYKPRRFSTWAPKAIATIRELADTLEDRAVVLQLQRRPKTASIVRLRKRDSAEFEVLRRQAARWADDNSSKLTDADPVVPDTLNDRAADNWRPLLAIADLAGGAWPDQARDAACVLSGEGHDTSINVGILADIRLVFGEDTDIIRSADLVAKLVADPERPWAEWSRGKPLTQKQLAGLLRPFGIISEEVHPPGQPHGKGYKRIRFEEAWAAYLPSQNAFVRQLLPSEARNRASAVQTGVTCNFRGRREAGPRGSKLANLANNDAGLRACADRKPESGRRRESDQDIMPLPTTTAVPNPQVNDPKEHRTCAQCRGPLDGKERPVTIAGKTVWLHPECQRFYQPNYPDLPDSLRRPIPMNGRGSAVSTR
jgi:putative DNA primase/helicase